MQTIASDLLPLVFSLVPVESSFGFRRVCREWHRAVRISFENTAIIHLQNLPKRVSARVLLQWFPHCEQVSYDASSEAVASAIFSNKPSLEMVLIGNSNAKQLFKPNHIVPKTIPEALSYSMSLKRLKDVQLYQVSITRSDWINIHHTLRRQAKQFVTYSLEEAMTVCKEKQESAQQICSMLSQEDKVQFLCWLAPNSQRALEAARFFSDAAIANMVLNCKIPVSDLTSYMRLLSVSKFNAVAQLLFNFDEECKQLSVTQNVHLFSVFLIALHRKLEKKERNIIPTSLVHEAILHRFVKNTKDTFAWIQDIAPSLLCDWTSDNNIVIYAMQHDILDIVTKCADVINENALVWRDKHGNTILQSAGRRVHEYLSQLPFINILVEMQSEVIPEFPEEGPLHFSETEQLLPKSTDQKASWCCAIL